MIKDWNILLKTEGKQLNFCFLSATIAAIIYAAANALQKALPITWVEFFVFEIIKALSFLLAAYYFVYSAFLTKKIIEKFYR